MKSVLIIDDEPGFSLAVSSRLEASGWTASFAQCGEVGVRMVRELKPDAVLLDIGLPDIDGYEVCKRLKSDAQTAAVPVIFLSAHAQNFHKRRAIDSGGVTLLTKPYCARELLHVLEIAIAGVPSTEEIKG